MHFTSHTLLDDGVIEREFTLDAVTGIFWMPPAARPSSPVPLLLLNQPGGFGTRRMYPRLVARARAAAADGFASVTIEPPGAGDQPLLPGTGPAGVDLPAALAAGEKPSPDVIDQLILPSVDAAVADWRTTLDAALALPEISAGVAFSGGVIAVGVRLAATDPRIAAAGLVAGSFVPRSTKQETRGIGIPTNVLLQWDDEGNDRQAAPTSSHHARRRSSPTWEAFQCSRGRKRGGSSSGTSGVEPTPAVAAKLIGELSMQRRKIAPVWVERDVRLFRREEAPASSAAGEFEQHRSVLHLPDSSGRCLLTHTVRRGAQRRTLSRCWSHASECQPHRCAARPTSLLRITAPPGAS